MQILTVPIKSFWVICQNDEDLNEEFSADQFEDADNYLQSMREEWPDKTIEMIAEIAA